MDSTGSANNSVRAAKRRVTCAGPPGRAVATEWIRGRHMIENDTLELVTLKFRRVTDAPPQSVSTQAHTGHGHQEANTTWRGRAYRRVQCHASVRVIAADKELTHSSCSRAHPDPLWLPGTRTTMPTWQLGLYAHQHRRLEMLPELAVDDSDWPPDAICGMWDAAGRQL